MGIAVIDGVHTGSDPEDGEVKPHRPDLALRPVGQRVQFDQGIG